MTVVEHHSVEELQTFFQREREARLAKRIWIVWQARLRHTAPEIAKGIGMSRRAVQEWTRRYNTGGLAGLQTRSGQGRDPLLSEEERQAVAKRLEDGPQAGDPQPFARPNTNTSGCWVPRVLKLVRPKRSSRRS